MKRVRRKEFMFLFKKPLSSLPLLVFVRWLLNARIEADMALSTGVGSRIPITVVVGAVGVSSNVAKSGFPQGHLGVKRFN